MSPVPAETSCSSALRPLTDDELAWIEASIQTLLRQQPDATAHVSFDDMPDGLAALLRRQLP
jgi:hypothetical protein